MKRKRAAIYRRVAETVAEEDYMGICRAFSLNGMQVYVDPQNQGIVFSDRAIEEYPELDIYNLKKYTMRFGYPSSYLACDTDDRVMMMLLIAEMTATDDSKYIQM